MFCTSTRVRSTTNPFGWNGLDIQHRREQQYTAVLLWSKSLIWDLWPERNSHQKCQPQIVTRVAQGRPGSRETKISRVPSFLTWEKFTTLCSFKIFDFMIPRNSLQNQLKRNHRGYLFWSFETDPWPSAPKVVYLEVCSKNRGLGIQECSPGKGPHTRCDSAVNLVNMFKWGTLFLILGKNLNSFGAYHMGFGNHEWGVPNS